MTANILTVGHIKCLEKLTEKAFVTVGLLTKSALEGYKEEVVPYKDREYILNTVALALGDIQVVPQKSLDPTDNLIEYNCTALASGDGFEDVELQAIQILGLKKVDVRLRGEKVKSYSTSRILDRD